jgi:hypothetical protein
MERGNKRLGNGEAADQFVHALSHLGGSFVGKSHRQDGFRHDTEALDQVRDAVGDDTRLAAARAGEDEQRALGGLDSLTLLRVELGEKGQGSKMAPKSA